MHRPYINMSNSDLLERLDYIMDNGKQQFYSNMLDLIVLEIAQRN